MLIAEPVDAGRVLRDAPTKRPSEWPVSRIASRADVPDIRYGQVWEDADVLLDGLDVQPGDVCLSIASAGDNALALLTRNPARVIAIDHNPAQLACLELRVAAFRELSHPQLLELIGSRPSARRGWLYARCRRALSGPARRFWDTRPGVIDSGIGSAGKFERYFALFRKHVLPLIHGRDCVLSLLTPRDRACRKEFYERRWNTQRWRWLFRMFFSRRVMARLGRDRELFRYVEGHVADRILERTYYALTELDPAQNPYLHWILTGTHGDVLPAALRPDHFDTIRGNLDRLEWRCQSLDAFVAQREPGHVDRYNLSDVFEYVSPEVHRHTLDRIASASRSGTRLAYWNLFASRRCAHRPALPPQGISRLRPLDALATRLHRCDRAFFYSAFVLEEVA